MSNNLLINKDFNVLVVEDEPILALAMEVKLKKLGLNISALASNASFAITHAQNNYPDLAIIDINLNEDKTGIDVANYLWRSLNIPIIFLTSYHNDNIVKKAMDCEPYAYLIKPCRDVELKVAIATVMNKHQYFFKDKKTILEKKTKYIFIKENIKFDLVSNELFIDKDLVKLTKNEKKLFSFLCQSPGRILSFDSIYRYIWREDAYDLAKLRSMIYRLKNKIGFNPFESFYEEGYRLKTLEQAS